MWIKDPITKHKSVSLTMLVITFLGSLIAAGLEMKGKIASTSIILEMFYASAGLYFSRRITFKGKQVGLDGKTLDDKVD